MANAPDIPVAGSEIAKDAVDFAALAAAGISDVAKLSDPAAVAGAVVDLLSRVGQLEQFAETVKEQVGTSTVLGRMRTFIESHFRE